MEPQVGLVSGKLEEQEYGYAPGSRVYAGPDWGWQTQPSYEKTVKMRRGGAFFDFMSALGQPIKERLAPLAQQLAPLAEAVSGVVQATPLVGPFTEALGTTTETLRQEAVQRGLDPRFGDVAVMAGEELVTAGLGKAVRAVDKVLPPPGSGPQLAMAGAAPMQPMTMAPSFERGGLVMEARLAPRRGGRGDFLPQEQYDVVRPERINAVRDKLDETKEVIQNIEENNPGVKKNVLAATNKEYKRAKENVEDLEALLSSEESNIRAPQQGNEWAYPPNMPRAKEVKAVENDIRGTVEAFELHHLIPKGISAAMMNRVRGFIDEGVATVEDLKRFAMRPTELGLPDIGDLETNLSPMSRIPHNRFHTEMRYQGSYQFPKQKLEISKQNLASELGKIKNFKDLERLWDEMLKGDVKYLVETARDWEKMDEAIRSVSPTYTGTALYKPKK